MADDDPTTELVQKAQRGDAAAMEPLVRLCLRPAYLVALSILGRPSDAEDVAQDAVIVGLQRIADCRNPKAFRPWLLQIVRNRARNWRTQRRLRDVPATEPHLEQASGNSAPDAGAFRFKLLGAMQRLSAAEREVLMLHDLEGWTHPEIADCLGISVVMSRQHLFQARRKLQQELAPHTSTSAYER